MNRKVNAFSRASLKQTEKMNRLFGGPAGLPRHDHLLPRLPDAGLLVVPGLTGLQSWQLEARSGNFANSINEL